MLSKSRGSRRVRRLNGPGWARPGMPVLKDAGYSSFLSAPVRCMKGVNSTERRDKPFIEHSGIEWGGLTLLRRADSCIEQSIRSFSHTVVHIFTRTHTWTQTDVRMHTVLDAHVHSLAHKHPHTDAHKCA